MADIGSLCQREKSMAHAWESLEHKAPPEKREIVKKEALAELKRVIAEAARRNNPP
jgi:hypothetical protein